MKKLVALITVFTMLFTVMAFAESSESKTVEISFKIGDSTLIINGSPVTVETPYVVGDGTTLVSVRVITEAFNAKVDWIEANQEVIIDYPDVHIVMHIGDTKVTVNDHTETLLAAPELTGSSTMVPLRFISETFDAEVGYDEKTQSVTVKKTISEQGQTVSGITTMDYIGDSHFKWSMETPSNLIMDERSFNGSYTSFVDNDDNYISIFIYPNSDKEDFETVYVTERDSWTRKLSVAEKLTDQWGNKYAHFAGSSSSSSIECFIYVTTKYIYEVYAYSEDKELFNNTMSPLMDSFSLSFDNSKTHDLANKNSDGTSKYTNEKFNLSFNLPVDWFEYDLDATDLMEFSDIDDKYYFGLDIVSKTGTVNSRYLCDYYYTIDRDTTNSKYVTLSEITDYKINDKITGLAYTAEVRKTNNLDSYYLSLTFEYGDYIYCINYKSTGFDKETIKKIIDSLSVEPIDTSKVGNLVADIVEEGTYTQRAADWSLTLPKTWAYRSVDNASIMVHKYSSATIQISSQKLPKLTLKDLGELVTNDFEGAISSFTTSKVSGVQSTKLNGRTYYFYTIKTVTDSRDIYTTVYYGIVDGRLFRFVYSRSEIAYRSKIDDDLTEIISTLTLS